MRSAALVEEAGARGRVVSLKTEAGTVTGMMSTGDTRGDILKNTGSGSGQARSDGTRTLGDSDIEAEGVEGLKTGIVRAAEST